jgi:hypothetical protein
LEWITIPPEIVEKRGLRPGDEIAIVEAVEGLLVYQTGIDERTLEWWSTRSDEDRKVVEVEARRYEGLSDAARGDLERRGPIPSRFVASAPSTSWTISIVKRWRSKLTSICHTEWIWNSRFRLNARQRKRIFPDMKKGFSYSLSAITPKTSSKVCLRESPMRSGTTRTSTRKC